MLDVSSLSAAYGKHRALDGASLKVAKGEIVVILGANGAGKTTLLKAVCGVCPGRVSGRVTMQGADLIGLPPHRIVEEGIALVPEGRGIFGEMTVEENLMLGAYPDRARAEAPGTLDRVYTLFPKLRERRRQVVRTMSGGEQQMVAIGRAMMSNPAILALDEPSLGLSPILCKELFRALKAVRDAGLGLLMVEQNARQSLAIADRGYLLENGAIVHEGRAQELLNDPAVQKAYLGGAAAPQPQAPPMPKPTQSPADIAAAALRGLTARAPSPPTRPTIDTGDLVARAQAASSRRATPAPVPAPPPLQQPAPPHSADRLQRILTEIEDAARRAEQYRPNMKRR
ncbi:MAG: ABC transporter ATP-binding protein [Pseudooceanicola sp.]|nr:ABC transporter ATP-binding protein [Pseudooceanicola sp.]